MPRPFRRRRLSRRMRRLVGCYTQPFHRFIQIAHTPGFGWIPMGSSITITTFVDGKGGNR